MRFIYKVSTIAEWEITKNTGFFCGSSVDRADGFIHFSTAAQLRETVARHFAGQADLMLLAVDAERLGPDLRWEPSRGGALFPHLYGDLPVTHVVKAERLPLGPDGIHLFPQDIP